MNVVVKSIAIVAVVALGVSLMAAVANAQQSTSAAPTNHNWCPGVPPSPPPPHFDTKPGEWEGFDKACSAERGTLSPGNFHKMDVVCRNACGKAQLLWGYSLAPANPDWCSDVPASPSPPNFDQQRGEWAAVRYMCMHKRSDRTCGELCQNAEERWRQQKAGLLDRPSTFPSPTDKPQGPFTLPGGAKRYILPMQPAPKVPTPHAG
jgi:hypothetical protein